MGQKEGLDFIPKIQPETLDKWCPQINVMILRQTKIRKDLHLLVHDLLFTPTQYEMNLEEDPI